MVLGDLVDDELAEWSEGAHISKDRDVQLVQFLRPERRRGEMLDLRKGSCLAIAHAVEVLLVRLQVLHDCNVDPAVEPAHLADVVGVVGRLRSLLQQAGNPSELDKGLAVVLGVGDPDDLHLALVGSEAQMDLLVARTVADFESGHADEFVESDL
jgi:hypothetical protein